MVEVLNAKKAGLRQFVTIFLEYRCKMQEITYS